MRRIPLHALHGRGSIYEGFATQGYAAAFADPPYGLLLSNGEKGRLFHVISNELFNNFNDDLEILSWSDNWSSFFDAGKEWWGAYWWTIHNKTKRWVIVVAASTTD